MARQEAELPRVQGRHQAAGRLQGECQQQGCVGIVLMCAAQVLDEYTDKLYEQFVSEGGQLARQSVKVSLTVNCVIGSLLYMDVFLSLRTRG